MSQTDKAIYMVYIKKQMDYSVTAAAATVNLTVSQDYKKHQFVLKFYMSVLVLQTSLFWL